MSKEKTVVKWDNWAPISDIAKAHNLTTRRTQQIIRELGDKVEYATLIWWSRKKPATKPVYRLVKKE